MVFEVQGAELGVVAPDPRHQLGGVLGMGHQPRLVALPKAGEAENPLLDVRPAGSGVRPRRALGAHQLARPVHGVVDLPAGGAVDHLAQSPVELDGQALVLRAPRLRGGVGGRRPGELGSQR